MTTVPLLLADDDDLREEVATLMSSSDDLMESVSLLLFKGTVVAFCRFNCTGMASSSGGDGKEDFVGSSAVVLLSVDLTVESESDSESVSFRFLILEK